MPHADVVITHPDRVVFPAHKITKRDLVDYYHQEVANTMLRHLKSRPLSVQRFTRGIDQQGFVQQDFADSLPHWMGRAEVAREGKGGGTVVHPVAETRDALRGSPTRTASRYMCGSRGKTGCTTPIDWSST